MGRRETLLRYCDRLQGIVDVEGWVSIHNGGVQSQQLSNECIALMRDAGFNFDILTVNGSILENVEINDAKIKATYNTSPELETLPPNGIKRWRLASEFPSRPGVSTSGATDIKINPDNAPWKADEVFHQVFSKEPLTREELEKAGLEPDVGPFYSNDKYKREIKPGVFIDVYDVIDCYEVTSGPLQHALKKILAPGQRGHKTYEQDLIDILSSVERALFQHQEKNK
jgi:hypothetical protein